MNPVIAWFPGQGAQHVGMGKELLENFAIARETFEEASDAIRLDLRKLCLEGPDSELVKTENTQPALLTASVAAFRVAQSEHGFAPQAAAGHSLGEYSALVAANALRLGTAVRWVRERGAAMQKAVPEGQGTMAAVLGLADERVEALCQEATRAAKETRAAEAVVESLVQPANFNAPGQVVIAGSSDAVAAAIRLVKENPEFKGGKAMPLAVSAPFHCRLMAPARSRMAEIFAQASSTDKPAQLAFPYVPNRTARLSREPGLVLEFLVEQVDHPVLWKQSVVHLLEAGFRKAVEFGPGKVLQGLAKRIPAADGATISAISVGDLAGIKSLESFK
jgi:[acyl-carrier-protein] S-malonyltransferase